MRTALIVLGVVAGVVVAGGVVLALRRRSAGTAAPGAVDGETTVGKLGNAGVRKGPSFRGGCDPAVEKCSPSFRGGSATPAPEAQPDQAAQVERLQAGAGPTTYQMTIGAGTKGRGFGS